MNRVFVDMDGVIVDFAGYMEEHGLTGKQAKVKDNAYLEMRPIEGAIDAVRSLILLGYDVWIATKPPSGAPQAYTDKVNWILRYLPELKSKIVITHNKGFLGDSGDFLCDDRPHKAGCEDFAGTLLRFESGYHWGDALVFLRGLKLISA